MITFSINDVTHRFNLRDKASIRKIPWQDRKRIIKVIEHIKQAEHVTKKSSEPLTTPTNLPQTNRVQLPQNATSVSVNEAASKLTIKSTDEPPAALFKHGMEPKPEQEKDDIDVLMQQLLMQQPPGSNGIPDKKSVYKWFLIVIAVIFFLALIFN